MPTPHGSRHSGWLIENSSLGTILSEVVAYRGNDRNNQLDDECQAVHKWFF